MPVLYCFIEKRLTLTEYIKTPGSYKTKTTSLTLITYVKGWEGGKAVALTVWQETKTESRVKACHPISRLVPDPHSACENFISCLFNKLSRQENHDTLIYSFLYGKCWTHKSCHSVLHVHVVSKFSQSHGVCSKS